jgi:asparagine synthase (glutamine-hydrolysing)
LRQRFADLMQGCSANGSKKGTLWKIVRLADVLALSQERRYAQWTEHFGPKARQRLYSPAFKETVKESNPDDLFGSAFAQSDAEDWLDTVLDADVNLYLADDLLVKMDRATMSHSLEARSPFLDHVFMEFVASLPVTFKQAWGQKKRILKASLRGSMPDALLDRPKMGFSVPIAEWFRTNLREMAHDILLSPRVSERGYFKGKEIARLLYEHSTKKVDHGTSLWDLLMLELWHREFLDRPAPLNSVRHRVTA